MPIQLSGSLVITGSITTTGGITISGSILSASYSSNSDLLQGTGSVGFTTTASFNAVSSSQQQISASYIALSGSYNTFSGSASTRVTQIENIYATTGSNSFRANQSITGSLVVSSTITAQTLVVQTVTSSIVYSSGSNLFGSALGDRQTFTGSVNITGSQTIFGNVGIGVIAGTNGAKLISAGPATCFFDAAGSRGISIYPSSAGNIHQITSDYIAQSYYSIAITARGNNNDLFISASGLIGIGTTTPLGKLDVYRPAGLSGTAAIVISNGEASPARNWALSTEVITSGDFAILCSTTTGGIPSPAAANTKLYITSAGSVGIGTTTPNVKFEIGATTLTGAEYSAFTTNTSGGVTSKYSFWRNYTVGGGGAFRAGYMANYNTDDSNNSSNSQQLVFATKSGTAEPTEKMRITSAGYTKMSSNGTYANDILYYHEMRQTGADWNLILQNTSATGATRGVYLEYTAYSPNGVANYPYYFTDSTAVRFYVASNGGIYNYQSNNSNLSDIRTKKDIAPLESYWNKFKDIEIVKFKYKDQTHEDYNIGVIAQQVEAVAPEFVDVDSWDMEYRLEKENTEKNSTEEPMKSIYTADLYHATIKVLQEAMAKIETLEAKVTALETK